MKVIGLTGGIASGKSFVAKLLAERGAVVLDADREAHAVLEDSTVIRLLADRLGADVQDPDGVLNRSAIAERVFGDSESAESHRRYLESLIHPRVKQRLQDLLVEAETRGAKAAVLDIPLLHEAGWADRCDSILFVDTSEQVRLSRVSDRGWTAKDLAARESAQMPISEKRSRSDHTLPGDEEAAARLAIEGLWELLVNEG